ncbi:MAG: hypothetical protein JSV62_00155 [Promethearchaeota archaeon]|nr:MAG: hypothetical protein JSV62_00155 [Candidatus Lokiarchaeota archaeon]
MINIANIILISIGAILTMLWGISHLFPTKNVVRDFGEISQDNKNIITMEWIIEGMSLIFIGLLVMLITLLGGINNIVTIYVNIISSVMLFALAVLSLLTGFKVNFIPFKLCPVIFTVSGILILIGSFV